MRFFYSFVFLLLSYCSLYAQQPSGREGALSRPQGEDRGDTNEL